MNWLLSWETKLECLNVIVRESGTRKEREEVVESVLSVMVFVRCYPVRTFLIFFFLQAWGVNFLKCNWLNIYIRQPLNILGVNFLRYNQLNTCKRWPHNNISVQKSKRSKMKKIRLSNMFCKWYNIRQPLNILGVNNICIMQKSNDIKCFAKMVPWLLKSSSNNKSYHLYPSNKSYRLYHFFLKKIVLYSFFFSHLSTPGSKNYCTLAPV